MHSRRSLAAAFLQLAALSQVAGVGIWTTHGPAPVRPVAVDPTSPRVVYAGTPDRVVRSDDGGQSWSISETVIGIGVGIQSLDVDPGNPQVLYVGKSSECPPDLAGAVFKSLDAGRTWVEAQPGIRCLSVQTIVADPLQPGTIFAATGPTLRNTSVGIYRSDDGGANWVRTGSPTCPVVFDLSVGSDRFLAATGGCGVWESVDRGITWTRVNGGLPSGAAQAVQTVARVPRGPLEWVIGTLAGIYRTADGTNWTETEVRAPTTDLVADPAHPGRLFAATFNQGVLRSDDGGRRWTAFNEGLTVAEIRSLDLDPSGRFLYAGTGQGVFQYEFPACDPARERNCLALHGGRFRVSLAASDARTQRTAEGHGAQQTEEFGWYSLPLFTGNEGNPEVFVKILDGRSVTGHFWVFHSGLTDLGYLLSVTDTETGETRNYRKEAGSACGGFETAHF